MAYKNDTPEIVNSPALELIKKIKRKVNITVYDKYLKFIKTNVLNDVKKIYKLNNINKFQAIIIMNNQKIVKIDDLGKNTIIIDPWRNYVKSFSQFNKNYIPVGIYNEI